MKVFTGQNARSQANSYLHQEDRVFTHVFIEIHDNNSQYRIYAVVTEDMINEVFKSDLKITVLN